MGSCSCRTIDTSFKNNSNAIQVNTDLTIRDIADSWKARWNIGRMSFKVNPGLYKTGEPGSKSEVFISANYKMSFDILRKNLKGIDAWIIVLETHGINVWCAAGKGTFGNKELVRMINKTKINELVDHNRLIVPQLGAPGVSAYKIRKLTGFRIIYGPIKASDIAVFLKRGLKATPEMRKVSFNLFDRIILAPLELAITLKYIPILFIFLYIVDTLIGKGSINTFYTDVLIFSGAIFTGTILFPILIPLLPTRYFFIKGWILGTFYLLSVNYLVFGAFKGNNIHLFLIPPLISFLAYNFTGATTFTSLSGVEKEFKIALPAYSISILMGTSIMILKLI